MAAQSGAGSPEHQPSGSVENALRTLQLLRDRRTIRVSEVASELGVARSTAHRLLTQLAAYGVIEQQGERSAYSPGPLLAQLGVARLGQQDLVETMHPYLERLSELAGETVHLMVRNGTETTFVDSVESRRHALRVTGRVGIALPAYATSAGKVLLAELPDQAVRDLFTGVAFERQTDRTIPDIDALIRELSDVRALGYATNRGESESGVAAIAVAQRDRTGAAVAAVAVSAPEPRLPPSRHTELVDLIRQVVGPAAQFVG